ncbi:uncharacterized protein LOC123293810 [Chrysoperla carnea]|uniref:uncharacterized protein LOC123293810 n=1 Tax=Chrysoperla carnea TaxID=189513 RepID=UPI001D06CBFC|nr:uncharacterized protein LOC123293810 [Chrysoperla carnea]
MAKFIAILCFVAVISFVKGDNNNADLTDLRNKIQQFVKNNRQDLVNVLQELGLPSLDPISIPQSFNIDIFNEYQATVSDITVTGLSSFYDDSLVILTSGLLGAVRVPKISIQGTLDLPQFEYTANIQAAFSEVIFAIFGQLSETNDQIAINDLQANVFLSSDSSAVKVVGNNILFDSLVKNYLTSNLKEILGNGNGINSGLTDILNTYLQPFVNKINSLLA